MKKSHKLLREGTYSREWIEQFQSPIPKHLTPEERELWEKEMRWQEEEIKRRKKEGFYPNQFHDLD